MKIYHYLLAIIEILICMVGISDYGMQLSFLFFSGSGLHADMYMYYRDMSRGVFTFYIFMVTAISTFLMVAIALGLKNKNARRLNRLSISVLLFVAVVVLCEIYLSSIFIGKG